jgi:hypothetical protein
MIIKTITITTKGLKLLQRMGWKGEGHGLGKNQQGITRPIDVDTSMNRFGLGFAYHFYDGYDQELKQLDTQQTQQQSNMISLKDDNNNNSKHNNRVTNIPPDRQQRSGITMRDLINNIHRLLANYLGTRTEHDLVFDKTLSADDRKLVHREAHKLGLKTRSEGAGVNRFLVVSKKRSTSELIESTLSMGQVSKYKLISKGDYN